MGTTCADAPTSIDKLSRSLKVRARIIDIGVDAVAGIVLVDIACA